MKKNFNSFIIQFSHQLHNLFHNESNIDQLSLSRGLPPEIWKEIMKEKPLSVAVPEQFGGRCAHVKECLRLLSATSYESLSLSLTFGINIGLFLEPLAKYGDIKVQSHIFKRFMNENVMGGLMITEPNHGSDALNMQTNYTKHEKGFKITGQKHWQGLTGRADFWIIAARQKLGNGNLSRDIDFFIADNSIPEQQIKVESYFNNLGLYMIPYGLNTLNVNIPSNQKLENDGTGIKTMLDILHRSRMQFPGMGMGFIRRMLDEAIHRCLNRKIGSQKLSEMDSVRYQLSQIQSAYSICSGMCARSSAISGIVYDLSAKSLEANSMKALVTDLMQNSAQICMQLSGANGYKTDHIVGRAIIDSRPFQIFEGSNEMLYTQIAETIIKQMKKTKVYNLGDYLSTLELTNKTALFFKKHIDFTLSTELPQRKLVLLGKIIARIICLQYLLNIVEKGFRQDLFDMSRRHTEMEIKKILSDYLGFNNVQPIIEYTEHSDWTTFT